MCRVVCGDIDTCADAVDDRRVGGKPTPAPKSQNHTFDETRTVMNTLVGQRLWKYKLMAGVLTIVVGAILLAWPGPSILVAATLFGVYLLVSGLAELFIAVTVRLSTATRVMLFISGALSVVLAILSFRHFGDAYAVLLLSLWIGIGFIFQGGSGVSAGIVSVLAGLVVLVWPFDSIAVLTLAVGIWLVIIGIVQIVQALQTRKHAKTAQHTVDEISNRLAA